MPSCFKICLKIIFALNIAHTSFQRPYRVHTTFAQRPYGVQDGLTANKELLQYYHSIPTARFLAGCINAKTWRCLSVSVNEEIALKTNITVSPTQSKNEWTPWNLEILCGKDRLGQGLYTVPLDLIQSLVRMHQEDTLGRIFADINMLMHYSFVDH